MVTYIENFKKWTKKPLPKLISEIRKVIVSKANILKSIVLIYSNNE